MTKVFQNLFGGGGDGGAAAAKASSDNAIAEQAKSREVQQVANDQQLASQSREANAAQISRRLPRGRRLFQDNSNSGSSSSVLG